ncbi:unnamed protein product [Lampetra fluviatilis]
MLRGAVAQRIAHSATNSDSSSQPTNTSDWSRASTIELDSATDRPVSLCSRAAPGLPISESAGQRDGASERTTDNGSERLIHGSAQAQLAGIPLSVAESALVNHSREPPSPERRAMRTFIFDEPRGSREARLEPSGGGGGATLAARRVRHGATSTSDDSHHPHSAAFPTPALRKATRTS